MLSLAKTQDKAINNFCSVVCCPGCRTLTCRPMRRWKTLAMSCAASSSTSTTACECCVSVCFSRRGMAMTAGSQDVDALLCFSLSCAVLSGYVAAHQHFCFPFLAHCGVCFVCPCVTFVLLLECFCTVLDRRCRWNPAWSATLPEKHQRCLCVSVAVVLASACRDSDPVITDTRTTTTSQGQRRE